MIIAAIQVGITNGTFTINYPSTSTIAPFTTEAITKTLEPPTSIVVVTATSTTPSPITTLVAQATPTIQPQCQEFRDESNLAFSLSDKVNSNSGKPIRILIREDIRPLSYFEDNMRIGFEIDLINKIISTLNFEQKITLFPIPSACRIDALLQGFGDVIVATLTINKERSEWVYFSEPYFFTGQEYLIRKDENFTDICTFWKKEGRSA